MIFGAFAGDGAIHAAARLFGWLRIQALVYNVAYWWAGSRGLGSFNYGYAPVSESILRDSTCPEPYQMELYRQVAETVGADHLRGRTVLEISCGLGGGFDYLTRHYGIHTGIAMDLSMPAVRAAKRRFGLAAVRADALALPIADASVDVAISVEAAHVYLNDVFLADLARVLKPSGLFVMADLRYEAPHEVEGMLARILAPSGMALNNYRDVTENVADACVADTPRREAMLRRVPWLARNSFRQMLGTDKSSRYREFITRQITYCIVVARKDAQAGWGTARSPKNG